MLEDLTILWTLEWITAVDAMPLIECTSANDIPFKLKANTKIYVYVAKVSILTIVSEDRKELKLVSLSFFPGYFIFNVYIVLEWGDRESQVKVGVRYFCVLNQVDVEIT